MEKQITRTIPTYNHIMVKVGQGEDGKVAVLDTQEIVFDEKMGSKKMAAWIRDNRPELLGYTIGKIEVVEAKYTMPVSTFIQHATKVN